MKKGRIIETVLIVLFSVVFILGICTPWRVGSLQSNKHTITYDTIWETHIDTIRYTLPRAIDSVVVRYVGYPIQAYKDMHIDSVDNKGDSLYTLIPITQKTYRDSLYTAYISGYMPSLDSIHLNHKRETALVVTRPNPAKRWSFGVQVGYGAFTSPMVVLSPYIGIGVSYSIIEW